MERKRRIVEVEIKEGKEIKTKEANEKGTGAVGIVKEKKFKK